MQNGIESTDNGGQPVGGNPKRRTWRDDNLDPVEQRLPIPNDVIIDEREVPSGNGWWVPEHRVILLRPGMSPARRNFVLAHETAHVLLGHHGAQAQERDIEDEADQLAVTLLLGAATAPSRRRALRAMLVSQGVAVPA